MKNDINKDEKPENGNKTASKGTASKPRKPRKSQYRPQTDASRPPPRVKNPTPGRPKFVPTEADRDKVMSALAIGGSQKNIARMLKIDQKTLLKHFRADLDAGYEMAKLEMGTVAHQAALKGRYDHRFVGALTHYENTRFGYKTNQGIDHTSSDKSLNEKVTVLILPE